MSASEIFAVLKQTIEEVSDRDPDTIAPETDISSLKLASLDFVSIQVAIKRKFKKVIVLEELPKMNLVTLQDFVDYIEKRPSPAPAA